MFFCDFCTLPMVEKTDGWIYEAESFILQAQVPDAPPLVYASDAGWLACDKCADMIDQDDAPGLEEKSVRHNIQHFGITDDVMTAAVRAMIHRLHSEFWKRKRKEATN